MKDKAPATPRFDFLRFGWPNEGLQSRVGYRRIPLKALGVKRVFFTLDASALTQENLTGARIIHHGIYRVFFGHRQLRFAENVSINLNVKGKIVTPREKNIIHNNASFHFPSELYFLFHKNFTCVISQLRLCRIFNLLLKNGT